MNEKQHRPDWTEYFLDIARAVGRRATCLRRRYGAIIVKDKIIISTGYNGAPRGEENCIDTGICERERLHVPKGQNYELCVAVHAEQNAIINADSAAMEGATIYIVGVNADGSLASGKPCLLTLLWWCVKIDMLYSASSMRQLWILKRSALVCQTICWRLSSLPVWRCW